MKSLTDSKSKTNDKTTETNNHSNSNITKNVNYTDLPKLGNHFASYKIKAQLLMSSGNDRSCLENEQVTVSEIGKKLNEIIKREFGCGKSQLEGTGGLKQNTSKFDVNRSFVKDKTEHESSTQRCKKVCESSDRDSFSRQSQNKRSVVEIDLTQFEDSEVNKPSSSNQRNSGKPYPSISKTNCEKTVYDQSEMMVPSTPSRKERQVMKRRSVGYDDSYLQARKSSGSSVDVRKAGVSSFYRMSSGGAFESNSKSKPPYGNKDSSKFSKSSSSQLEDREMSFKNALNERSDISKAKVFYGSNNRGTHIKATKAIGKPFCSSKDTTKFNSMPSVGNKARSDQRGKTGLMEKFSEDTTGQNSFFTSNGKQTHLPSRNMTTFESKDISKISTFGKATGNRGTSDCGIVKDTSCSLGSDEDLFGSDDELDELLANSLVDDLDSDGCLRTEGDSSELKRTEKNDDDGGMEGLFGNLDNDLDDATLVACCDDVMSPTIPIRESGHNSRHSGPSRGVKRKLNIPDAQSKISRSKIDNDGLSHGVDKSCNDDNEVIKECPLCSKHFHSG